MNDIIYCELWDEKDGIYVQFDDSLDITSDEYRDIFDKLIGELGYDESGSHELFYSCIEHLGLTFQVLEKKLQKQ